MVRLQQEAIRLKEKGSATEIVAVSMGPAKAQETLRTALAMGADRALLVETDDATSSRSPSPSCWRPIVEDGAARLVLLGKQAIDDDSNQTGPDAGGAARTGRRRPSPRKLEVAGGKADVTREVDGGLQTIEVDLPAVVTADLRLNEPRYASLPNIMKAKKKPLDVKKPADLGVDVAPRLTVLEDRRAAEAKAGVKVEIVASWSPSSRTRRG